MIDLQEAKPRFRKEIKQRNVSASWEQTQSTIFKVEKIVKGRLVTSFEKGINREDVRYLYSHLHHIKKQNHLCLLLSSPGGSSMAALQMIALLREFCERLTVLVPEQASSAATLLALGADKLIMGPMGFLSAIDTSASHPLAPKDKDGKPVLISVDEVQRCATLLKEKNKDVDIYQTLFQYIHPLVFGGVDRSKDLSELIGRTALSYHSKSKKDRAKMEKIVRKLNTEYPAHGYPITRKEARKLGLTIEYSTPELDEHLWNIFQTYQTILEPAVTDLSEIMTHKEEIVCIMESENVRTANKEQYDRVYNTVANKWEQLNDETDWYTVTKEETGLRIKRTKVEF